MTKVAGTSWGHRADQLAYASLIIITGDIIVGLLLGLFVAIAWPILHEAGDGQGGGWGVPDLVLTFALFLSLPSLVFAIADGVRQRWSATRRGIAFIGPLIISIGFIPIAHALDPCVLGLFDQRNMLGTTPLCE